MKEIWKDVVGYEGIYKVSNIGNIISCKRLIFVNTGCFYSKEFLMKTAIDKLGYVRVGLTKNNKKKLWLFHRVIALAFIPNPSNYPMVNHIDGNKSNNSLDNLEWCTASQNISHSFKNGLSSKLGEKNNSCKLTESQVLEIRKIHLENPETKLIETAKKFGISKQLVSRINLRLNWTHI
jgi:hypothetical protein